MIHPIIIESLNIGAPKVLKDKRTGEAYTSSMQRHPTTDEQILTMHGFEGDSCKGECHHGEFMRVNVFCTEKYAVLEKFLKHQFPHPSFGENFTLSGWPEETAAVGDVLRVGTCLFQITQPREPCSKVLKYHGIPNILKCMIDHGASGYYLRIMELGSCRTGDHVTVLERGNMDWTIDRLNRAMYQEIDNWEQVQALQHVEYLSPNWKASLLKQAQRRLHRS